MTNAGSITGGKINADGITFGSAFAETVTNKSGGTISGFDFGVTSDAAATVANDASATIRGGAGGVSLNGPGTVTNAGAIAASVTGSTAFGSAQAAR